MKKILLFFTLAIVQSITPAGAQKWISETSAAGAFPIAAAHAATALYVDPSDHAVVQKATALLQHDIEKVTGLKPSLLSKTPTTRQVIIIGTIGHSAVVDALIQQKKLKTDAIKGKWEAYGIQVVTKPMAGVDAALVIAGSDRRGTAYGVLEVSKQIGVSPWYYWADVPVQKKRNLFYTGGTKSDAPVVKYRGIFINDEAPALSGWSRKTFGGFNHHFYEKVFELILRLKGNYLWPAMWGSAFYDDDSLNKQTADDYAIVIGTSHHEPLMRAHDEWRRYGKGKWNYDSNEVRLKEFWRGGMQRASNEKIVSIGMRGDGDEPMSRETATALLERIVKDQRSIIEEVSGKPAAQTPQLWALYKEVQDYYDKGMRVPDDVTLLLCDDNWGNIRKLPKLNEPARSGGYGIYYHYDYVGGPRNYKWLNTNQIERTWEQMHLAYRHRVDKIWIVNVGDIKPMEFPTHFFLDYAWNPEKWTAAKLPSYYTQWAAQQFGATHATAIGDLIATYTKYNSRRKPELLAPETYSLTAYNEADRIVTAYNALFEKAENIAKALPPAYKDAYYQLVLHPVQASANVNELYVTVAKNRHYAKMGNNMANKLADKAKALYIKDSLITKYYNDTLSGGKWSHMMDQTHIGYTYWQQPDKNVMPAVIYLHPDSIKTKATTASLNNDDKPVLKNTVTNLPKNKAGNAFREKDGYVSIEAVHFTKAINTPAIQWQVIPNLGRTLSSITPFPVTAAAQTPSVNSPRLEYQIYLTDTCTVKVHTYLSPTLNYHGEGLRFAISIDDEAPRIINMHEGYSERLRNTWVADNIIQKISEHKISKPGGHVLKFWMVDAGVVLQKIVIDAGGLERSYLGPEETRIK